MIKLTQPQAYKVVNFILKNPVFRQVDIVTSTGVTKGMVSYVVQWLEQNMFVGKKTGKYELLSAGAIFNLFPLYRRMEKNLIGSFSINESRDEVLKELIKYPAVFCTTTALQEYSNYFHDPRISFYSDDQELLKSLSTAKKGSLPIWVYKPDLCLEIDIEKKKKMQLTGKIRTIIDLYCNNQAYTAKELIEKLYLGERID